MEMDAYSFIGIINNFLEKIVSVQYVPNFTVFSLIGGLFVTKLNRTIF